MSDDVREAVTDAGLVALDALAPGAGTTANVAIKLARAYSSHGKVSAEIKRLEFEEQIYDIVTPMFVDFLTGLVPRFEASWKAWDDRRESERPSPADVAATFREFHDVYARTTDRKKRELLANAIVNAFDPELYEQAITQELIALFDSLTYADVAALRDVTLSKKAIQVAGTGTLLEHHIRKLTNMGLLAIAVSNEKPQTAADWNGTDLGRRLIQLLRDPAA